MMAKWEAVIRARNSGSTVPRDDNLKRASLTASVPAGADAIPRIDTLADILAAARVRTGHDIPVAQMAAALLDRRSSGADEPG